MSSSIRIAVVGSANTDLTTFVDAIPRAGETVFGTRFALGFGGKGANQAIAARLCGAEVVMVARVGDDLFGRATIANFESFGIGTQHVRLSDGIASGVGAILVEPSGQNRIVVVKGANDALTPADVDAASTELRAADAIILQFEVPLETVYHTVRFADAHGIRCIVNPAPAVPAELNSLTTAGYLVPNETEAELTTGLKAHSLEAAEACAAALIRRGFKRVVITLGERGSLLASAAGARLIAPFAVTPVDTTGAGDAFIGSFAVFLAEGMSEADALLRANLYAALSTTAVGAQQSFPTRAAFAAEWARRRGPG